MTACPGHPPSLQLFEGRGRHPLRSTDCVVVGGSFAGLAAALQLARARRDVLVVDAGLPRNRFAAASHGVLGQDGRAPAAILADARAQLLAYPSVRMIRGSVESAQRDGGGFTVKLESGVRFRGARLILATGVVDQLPEIPGLPERWGRTVLHCPYCHGYELGGGPLGVLATGPGWFAQALLVADWGPVTLFTNGIAQPGPSQLAALRARGVRFEGERVAELVGDGGRPVGLVLRDGRVSEMAALFLSPGARQGSPLAGQLGCRMEDLPSGPMIGTDESKETSVAGVFAAGDAASSRHSGSRAAADGTSAGIGAHLSLIRAQAAEIRQL